MKSMTLNQFIRMSMEDYFEILLDGKKKCKAAKKDEVIY